MNQTFQSYEEQLRVLADWLQHFAPADLVVSGDLSKVNAEALIAYVDSHLGGIITTSNLVVAEKALREAGQLQLIAPPTQEQIQIDAINEQQQRWQRQNREAIEANRKERNFAAEVDAKNAEAAREKEQYDAERMIENVISHYSCGHPRLSNVIDYARTEARQRDLRKIKVYRNGKFDAVLTLATVREAITNMSG